MISKEQLEKYKDISDQEALEQATKLLNLIKIIYKPMIKEEFGRLQKRRKETN